MVNEIYVPSLKKVIEELRKLSHTHLFSTVPIGEPATVYLRCDESGYEMCATGCEDDIDLGEGYEALGQLYLGDTEAELRACAHRLLTTVRDALVLSDASEGYFEILEICA